MISGYIKNNLIDFRFCHNTSGGYLYLKLDSDEINNIFNCTVNAFSNIASSIKTQLTNNLPESLAVRDIGDLVMNATKKVCIKAPEIFEKNLNLLNTLSKTDPTNPVATLAVFSIHAVGVAFWIHSSFSKHFANPPSHRAGVLETVEHVCTFTASSLSASASLLAWYSYSKEITSLALKAVAWSTDKLIEQCNTLGSETVLSNTITYTSCAFAVYLTCRWVHASWNKNMEALPPSNDLLSGARNAAVTVCSTSQFAVSTIGAVAACTAFVGYNAIAMGWV